MSLEGMPRIIVTGAGGMLGRDLLSALSGCDVYGLTHSDLDITNVNLVARVFDDMRPDIVIHSAAYTDVDGCELDPDKAYRVNALGTRNVTVAANRVKCVMVYISTDYVFDGTKDSPYVEWDEPNPLNAYGMSKLLGEEFVRELSDRFYIVRTSWLYGRGGKNFVDTILKKAETEKSLRVVDDQRGSPTYTKDLASKIIEVIGLNKGLQMAGRVAGVSQRYGIYHITNSGYCSWYDLAREIVGNSIKVIPIKSTEIDRPAKRPKNSVLENRMLLLEGIGTLRPWKEALKDYTH